MTEMLERVARAIASAGMPLSEKDSMRRARAAMEAMKKPTPAMVKAGESWSALPSQTWEDMIDAALEEGETE